MHPNSLIFSSIRNPFDQYVSSYLITRENKMPNITFDDFIDIVCNVNFKPSLNFGESFYLSTKFMFYQMFNDDGKYHVDFF